MPCQPSQPDNEEKYVKRSPNQKQTPKQQTTRERLSVFLLSARSSFQPNKQETVASQPQYLAVTSHTSTTPFFSFAELMSHTHTPKYHQTPRRPQQQASQGTAECALATVMGAHGQTTTEPLHSPHLPNQKASVTVRAEQAKNSSDLVVFQLGGTNCPRGHKR